jgi:hypothetical protein
VGRARAPKRKGVPAALTHHQAVPIEDLPAEPRKVDISSIKLKERDRQPLLLVGKVHDGLARDAATLLAMKLGFVSCVLR